MTDLNNMAKEAYEVARTREENGANIKSDTFSMLKHCATEVVDATEALAKTHEHFDCKGILSFDYAEQFRQELADIITCVLIVAGKNNIDIEQALKDVQEKNKARAEGRGDKK